MGVKLILVTVLAVYIVGQSHAMTKDETLNFGTTGMPERNTGLVGWVTVKRHPREALWILESNGIPDHDTGDWPGANPNEIVEQSYRYNVPITPVVANNPTCLPGGPIGMAINGIPLFNPWNADSENAVEGPTQEIFDLCDGHPDPRGQYHYHKMPASCLLQDQTQMIGVAFDGFAIYGPVDETGNTLTSADLDECHGRYNSDGVYQYHTTTDFPYILGCFKGQPNGIRIDPNFCHFASDADESGNIPKAADFEDVDHFADVVQDDFQVIEDEEQHPRVPVNLWKRRLPQGYVEWLSNKVFQ
ncbi:uncharacterized protein [Amphiura filiformis]|uniref:uncharacterized protein n=1 Tax=Amphiura filiformis TaxID=82378 RepID=UPI003B214A2D